jgi:elongator complex protein 1
LKEYESQPELQDKVKRAFGDYLIQRGYVQEAGFMYMNSEEPEDLQKSLDAFKKCGNIEMCLSIAYSLGVEQEQIEVLMKDLVTVLTTAGRFKEAGDLLCRITDYSIQEAVEYYSKGNAFMEAIRECMKEEDEDLKTKLLLTTKTSVNLAYDVKKNQILKVLEDFDKRYLRLKIVQNNKKNMPVSIGGLGVNGGLGFDADQMSMSGASDYSSSQLSSSLRSSGSSFSQTSKKSKRVNERKTKKTMRRKRQVKEGSPYEEENLLDMLREEVVITAADKQHVKEIMNALVYFQLIGQSIQVHKHVASLIRASNLSQKLLSVEQQSIIDQQPDLRDYYFPEQLGKVQLDEKFKESLAEWENLKFFKH